MVAHEDEGDLETFRRLVNERLAFLVTEHGFRETEARCLMPGMWVTLRNATTEVTAQYEYDTGASVTIARLTRVHGDVVVSELYNFVDLLALRAPHRRGDLALARFDEASLGDFLQDIATGLVEHGADVLRGDFTCFADLKSIKAKRVAARQGL